MKALLCDAFINDAPCNLVQNHHSYKCEHAFLRFVASERPSLCHLKMMFSAVSIESTSLIKTAE